jgi:hypothetical protein
MLQDLCRSEAPLRIVLEALLEKSQLFFCGERNFAPQSVLLIIINADKKKRRGGTYHCPVREDRFLVVRKAREAAPLLLRWSSEDLKYLEQLVDLTESTERLVECNPLNTD